MQIAVVPGRLDAVEDARDGGIAVPADAEAVTVRRLGAERRMQALIDQGVRWRVERFFEEDGRSRVREPAAHQPLLSVAWRQLWLPSDQASPRRARACARARAPRAHPSSAAGWRSSRWGDARRGA